MRLPLLVAVAGLMIRFESPVSIHLAGDSTMAPKREDRRPETGWGERLQDHFAPAEGRVVNHAMNGRNTRTFISEGRWQALIDSLRCGDYVFIQFGHNDASEDRVDRYTPPADYRAPGAHGCRCSRRLEQIAVPASSEGVSELSGRSCRQHALFALWRACDRTGSRGTPRERRSRARVEAALVTARFGSS